MNRIPIWSLQFAKVRFLCLCFDSCRSVEALLSPHCGILSVDRVRRRLKWTTGGIDWQAPPPAAPAVSNECLHPNFDLDDYLGYYCDDCGANNIEMPTQDKKKKEECPHKLEYRDDAGIFCSDCGKIFRDIENLFVAKEVRVSLLS